MYSSNNQKIKSSIIIMSERVSYNWACNKRRFIFMLCELTVVFLNISEYKSVFYYGILIHSVACFIHAWEPFEFFRFVDKHFSSFSALLFCSAVVVLFYNLFLFRGNNNNNNNNSKNNKIRVRRIENKL